MTGTGPNRRAAKPIALLSLLLLAGCAGGPSAVRGPSPPTVVPSVDLARYAGRWYEVAKYPNRFQRGCDGATATYSLRPDGRMDVVNRCVEEGGGGSERTAKGVARVVDPETRARLSVTFFWPFSGDYWILALGKDYDYAVVGDPSRKYLWILSRTPTIPEARYAEILEAVERQGFDPGRLVRSRHPAEAGR